jgi:uncharacterized protein (TIGR00730 family)
MEERTMPARRVVVFGSSVTPPDQPAYDEARRLGRELARAGWEVWSGGYLGVMSAVSEGAREAGGTAVGVTMAPWARFHPGNRWLSRNVEAADMHERLRHLTTVDAAIALHGGIGTLSEVALFWYLAQMEQLERLAANKAAELKKAAGDAPAEVLAKLLQPALGQAPARPLILVGPSWAALWSTVIETLAIVPADRQLVTLVSTVEECLPVLERRTATDPRTGG